MERTEQQHALMPQVTALMTSALVDVRPDENGQNGRSVLVVPAALWNAFYGVFYHATDDVHLWIKWAKYGRPEWTFRFWCLVRPETIAASGGVAFRRLSMSYTDPFGSPLQKVELLRDFDRDLRP
jgi:hypothetical protein